MDIIVLKNTRSGQEAYYFGIPRGDYSEEDALFFVDQVREKVFGKYAASRRDSCAIGIFFPKKKDVGIYYNERGLDICEIPTNISKIIFSSIKFF